MKNDTELAHKWTDADVLSLVRRWQKTAERIGNKDMQQFLRVIATDVELEIADRDGRAVTKGWG